MKETAAKLNRDRRPIPEWFPKALAWAQHADQMNKWPWYGRLFHRLFIKCPCCKGHGETWRNLWRRAQ